MPNAVSDFQDIEFFQQLLNSPYEGIVFVDQNGVIKYVNDSFAQYNRLPKDRLIGKKHREIPVDENLDRIIQTREYEPLAFYTTSQNRKMIVSRRPVYIDGEFAGVFARYLSIDPIDVDKNFGQDYIDLITRLQTRSIMYNVSQTIIELNSYKAEFNQLNTTRLGIDNIIGTSPVMKELKKRLLLVSNSPSSVLLTGESGTGKELFANAIHFHGNRCDSPFVKVNCAAIPEPLLEAELFGYDAGAFTGALKSGKMGKFELANYGTIFLDEIGDMPLAMQSKLLRVLQEKEVERLGGEGSIPIDVRVISAANQDLHTMVREGTFREDLYYRLNVVNFNIPPLRERMSDLPKLAHYFVGTLNRKLTQSISGVTPEAMELLLAYDWPGNIREIINVLEGAMNFCQGSMIDIEDLPFFMRSYQPQGKNERTSSLQTSIDDAEKTQLVAALMECNGNRTNTANKLGISRTTLYRLMKKHHLIK